MKTRFEHHNEIRIDGYLVKDAFVNEKGNMASFRIGKSMGKDQAGNDRPSIFLGCVIFAEEGNPLPMDLLKKGDKPVLLDVTGHLRNHERRTQDGRTFNEIEIVVDRLAAAKAVIIEDENPAPAGGEGYVPAPDEQTVEDMPEGL